MRSVFYVSVILICATSASQNPGGSRRQFEVASIKQTVATTSDDSNFDKVFRDARRNSLQSGAIPMTSPNRVRLQHWPLLDLIAVAYSVRASQVSGPSWLSNEEFDIEALVPEGTHRKELNGMLQLLLEERFGLRVHRSPQTVDGYLMVVAAGGPRLMPAQPEGDLSPKNEESEKDASLMQMLAATRKQLEDNKVEGNVTIQSWLSITPDELASQLGRFTGQPIVDGTGLKGKYSDADRTERSWGTTSSEFSFLYWADMLS